MRVAIVHDWLTGMRGGEKVLEDLLVLFPEADLYTLVHVPGRLSPRIEGRRVVTSFIDRLPWAWRRHQIYLPFFPAAVEGFDLAGYDLVLSSSHCVAKGALTRTETLHVCYCHTPMRYAWDFHALYRAAARPRWLAGPLFALTLSWLRIWDQATARRPWRYVANSATVARRIRRTYGADADVVNPPVDTDFYVPSGDGPGDHCVLLSAMVPYKNLELAVAAFTRAGRPLHVLGEGTERRRLEAMAGPSVTFRGWVSDEEVRAELQSCRALIFPGEEDFGITPLEANACGRPVVAYRRGGVTESQEEGSTAVFFDEPTEEALGSAVETVYGRDFDPSSLAAHAARFGRDRFRSEIREHLDRYLTEWARECARPPGSGA